MEKDKVLDVLREIKGDIVSITSRLKDYDERIAVLEREVTKPKVGVAIQKVNWDGEKKEEFLRWFGAAITKTLNTSTDAEGGYLVPQEFRPELLRLVENYGTFRKNARVIPMTKTEMAIPKLTTGAAVYWPGEGNIITETNANMFGRALLTAKKLAGYITVTNELLEDASLDIVDLIVTIFAEAIAKEEDRVGYVGKSAAGDPFDGILNTPGVNVVTMPTGKTAFSDIAYDDLCNVIAAVPRTDGCVWVFHRTILNLIRKLKDNQGHPIWSVPVAGDPPTLLGYPYIVSDVMPSTNDSGPDKPFVIFGNLKYAVLGDRRQITVGTSEHVKFAEDEIAVKVVERIAINIAVPNAFAVLKTAAG